MKPAAPVAAEARISDMQATEEFLTSVLELLRRQIRLMLVVFVAVVALAGLYFFTAQPKFTSTAKLIIDSRKTQMLQQQTPMGVDSPIDSPMVDSQVEILKSENVELAVIRDLHLIDEPEFTQPGGGLVGTIISGIMSLFPSDPKSEYELTRTALAKFDNALIIKRVGMSYVIEISFQSISSDRSARIANAVAEAYIVDSLEAKYQASRRAATWLQDRLKELRAQASAADRSVVEFKAKNNIVDAGGRLLNEQQLAETNSALTIARAQTAEAQARYERIDSILRNENRDATSLLNDLATVADSLRNDVIVRLRQQYLDLSAREADWSSRYGSEHLAVKNLRNQMREIRRSITDELRRIAESQKSDLEIARSREASLQTSLTDTISSSNDTNQAQIVLRDLESNAQSTRALADNFLQLYMVSVQQQSFPMTEARLITQAAAPLKPSSPKLLLVVALAIVGGGILAMAVGAFRDFMDRVFRTNSQIEARLGLACLSVIPVVPQNELSAQGAKAIAPPTGMLQGTLKSLLERRPSPLRRDRVRPQSSEAIELAASRNFAFPQGGIVSYFNNFPFSRFAESIRAIKLAIDLNVLNSQNKVIGITSTLPNEGKTTISATLAQLIAHSGMRTLLIDGDLRNPTLTRDLAPDAKLGIIDVVLGNASIDDVIWTETGHGLNFLPCVASTQLPHTSEILSSAKMRQIFDELQKHYDCIIVDLSPLAPIVDVRATGELIGAYILVVEWAQTKIAAVEHVLEGAPELHERMLGTVLNKADLRVMSRYSTYRGNYYHNEYYRRYGYTD
jgi:succinoglycan biosynthesis transport protein ExoP